MVDIKILNIEKPPKFYIKVWNKKCFVMMIFHSDVNLKIKLETVSYVRTSS